MTSSLRNSIHRPTHKERSQLSHRRKYGFLEKHSDYVKRARDYHSKQDRLTRLRQKAAERNKDEFYFSMTREKTRDGVHVKDRGNVALPTDIVKVLKTQDENYVRTMRMANLKKIDRLKTQLMEIIDLVKDENEDALGSKEIQVLQEAGILPPPPRKGRRMKGHIIFVDNEEEAQKFVNQAHSSSSEEQELLAPRPEPLDLGWKTPKKDKGKKKETSTTNTDLEEHPESSARSRTRILKELSARLVRDKQLRYSQREFEMQRLMMGKGARKKISGVEKVGNEDEDEDEEDEDEIDARKGKQRKSTRKVDEATYKPRVYKWKLERKH